MLARLSDLFTDLFFIAGFIASITMLRTTMHGVIMIVARD